MSTPLVLTAIGPDKPGLVELLSKTLAEHDANWLESSMSHLAGQFAGILIAAVAPERLPALKEALAELAPLGLTVSVTESEPQAPRPDCLSLTLELVGHDKPGIVRDIARALAARNVNVEKLSTELVSGSMSAEELFKAHAELQVPPGVDLDALQQSLEGIASDLMVDITLQEGH